MAYKVQRNKAYASDQYFTCDFNGVDWITNAYIAEPDTTEPRNTATCKPRYITTHEGNKPLLGNIVDVTKHTLTELKTARSVTEDTVKLNFSTKDNTIQRRYFDYFMARYPSAVFKTGGELRYEAISIYSDNQLIGIVMPLKD